MTTFPNEPEISDGVVKLYLAPRRDGGVQLALLKDGVATEIALDAERIELLRQGLAEFSGGASAHMTADAPPHD